MEFADRSSSFQGVFYQQIRLTLAMQRASLLLSPQPDFGIELGRLLTELELQDVVVAHSAQSLTGAHFLASMHTDRFQVGINGDVDTMPHHHHPRASET